MLEFAQKLIVDKSPKAALSFAELWQTADEAERYHLDEQAAILEYDAGFTRAQAEAKAALVFQRQAESEAA